jgi:predicted transposase/invertase (TIGR01784 family)
MSKKLIRFDWAMKKMLRNKANFDILEGLLSELLLFDVLIVAILESEGNKQYEYDKYNRVDILVKSKDEELMLIEVQNGSEADYFQRMLYGVSKLVTEYIKEGETYGTIKKIYSINIVYFSLGQGKDYVYEYRGEFVGLHTHDVLKPNSSQKKHYKIDKIADIFPKYYILKVNNYDKIAESRLDEWIYFLKNNEVKDEFKAKGLDKVREKLQLDKLSDEDKYLYLRSVENKRIEKSVEETAKFEAQEAKALEIAKNAMLEGANDNFIAKITGLAPEQIQELRESL